MLDILTRYLICLTVGLVVALALSFSGLIELSGTYFSKNIYLSLFILMLPSILVWHLIAQLPPIAKVYKVFTETRSATITAAIGLLYAYYIVPGVSLSKADTALFIGIFYIAACTSGLTMDYIKAKRSTSVIDY